MKVRTVFISVFCALVAVFSGNRLFLLFAGLGLVGLLDGLGLSEVETDGLYLYVSNLLRKGRVPLTDVAEVSLGVWPRFRIIVDLRGETPLGRRIAYEPPMDWMATAYDHRGVRELKALVAQAIRHSPRAIS
jgi:hypothetical protein